MKSSVCLIPPSTLSLESVSANTLQLVLSNPWHLFATAVYGPVAKSGAFCLKVMEVTNPKH